MDEITHKSIGVILLLLSMALIGVGAFIDWRVIPLGIASLIGMVLWGISGNVIFDVKYKKKV